MNISNYLKNALANAALRGQAFTPPPVVRLHLYTSDPTVNDTGQEMSGRGYTPMQVVFGAPVEGQCPNTLDINFPAATSDWPPITHAGIRDTQMPSNLLFFGPLDQTLDVPNAVSMEFKAGDVVVGFE